MAPQQHQAAAAAEHQPAAAATLANSVRGGGTEIEGSTAFSIMTVPSTKSHKKTTNRHHHPPGATKATTHRKSKILRNISQAKHTKRFPHTNALLGAFDNMRTKETTALRKRQRFLRALRRHRNALKRQQSFPNLTKTAGARVFPNIEAASSGTTLPAGSIGPSASGTTLIPLFTANSAAVASGAVPVPVDHVQVFVRLRPGTEFANANFYIAPSSNHIEVFKIRGERRKTAGGLKSGHRRCGPNDHRQNLLAQVDANQQQQNVSGKLIVPQPKVDVDSFAAHNNVTAQHDPSKKVFNWRFSFDGVIHDMYIHASKSLANLAQQQTQLHTFDLIGRPLIQAALRGTNSVLLSCGHAKTGKSYSLVGNLNRYDFRGLVPRALQYLYQQLSTSQQQARVYLQYYDVYGDHLVDFLSPSTVPVKQRNMTLRKLQNLLYVHEMNLQQIAREEDALKIFMIGESFRQSCRQQQRSRRKRVPSITRNTLNHARNEDSEENVNEIPRSHSIFTIYIEQQRPVVPQQPSSQQRPVPTTTVAQPPTSSTPVPPPPPTSAQQQPAVAANTENAVIIDDRIICSKICFVELASPHRLPKHSYIDPHRRTEISEVNKSLSFLEHSILMLSESQPLISSPQPAPLSKQPPPSALPPSKVTAKHSTIQQRPVTAGVVPAAPPAAAAAAATSAKPQQKPIVLRNQQPQIPSRTCKLTYALKDLLNNKTYCIILAHVCGQRSKLNETLATLHFASRMKLVPICPMRTRRIDRRRRMRKLEAEVEQLTKDLRMAALLQQPQPPPNDPTFHLIDDDPAAPQLTPEEAQRLKREVNEFLKGNPSRLDSPTFRSSFKQMRLMFAYMQRAIRNGFLQQQQQQAITNQQQQQLQQQQQQLLAAAVSPLEASNTNSTVIEPASAPATHAEKETRRERRGKGAAAGDKKEQQASAESQHDKSSRDHGDRPTLNNNPVASHFTTDDESSVTATDDAEDSNVARPAPNAKQAQRLAVGGGNNPTTAKISGDIQSIGGGSVASSSGKQQQAAQQSSVPGARKGNQPTASGRKGTATASAHNSSAKEIQAAAAAAAVAAAAAASSATSGGDGAGVGGKTQNSSHSTSGDTGAGAGSEAGSDDDKLQRASTAEGGSARTDGDLTAGGGIGTGGGAGDEIPPKSDAYNVFIRSTPHGTLIYQTLVQNKKVVHEKEERIKENSAHITGIKDRIRSVQKRLRLCERVWKVDKKQKLLAAQQVGETPGDKDSKKTTTASSAAKKPDETITDGCIAVEERDYEDVRLLIQLQKELSEKKEMLDRLKREFHAALDFVSRTRLFLMRQFLEWYDTTYANALEKRVNSPTIAIAANSGPSGGSLPPQAGGALLASGPAQPASDAAVVANVHDASEHAALERDPQAVAFFHARLVAEKWSEAQALSKKWSKIDA